MIVAVSNIFPVPQRGQWNYTWPVKRTPTFRTIKEVPADNTGEVHISLTPFVIWEWDLDIPFLKGDGAQAGSNTAWHQVVGFYGAQRGSFKSWFYLDPYDNGVDEDGDFLVNVVGVGDGLNVAFQTTRVVGPNMIDLIQNFVEPPTVYVNGFAQPSSAYTIDDFGALTFVTAPPATASVAWSGQFYFRCYFDQDNLPLQEDLYRIWSIKSLKFHSALR